MDKAGIPNVLITGFTSVAYNVGANRIVFGGDFTCPTGNPNLPIEDEKEFRRNILIKAIYALTQDVTGPTIFTVDESKEG